MRRSLQFVFSIVFFIVNTAVSLIAYNVIDMYGDDIDTSSFKVMSLILMLIYIISAVVIKRKWDINFFRLLFIQSGGYAVLTFLVIELLLIRFNIADANTWNWSDAAMWVMAIYLSMMIPALAIGGIITALILHIMKNRRAEKDGADTE